MLRSLSPRVFIHSRDPSASRRARNTLFCRFHHRMLEDTLPMLEDTLPWICNGYFEWLLGARQETDITPHQCLEPRHAGGQLLEGEFRRGAALVHLGKDPVRVALDRV